MQYAADQRLLAIGGTSMQRRVSSPSFAVAALPVLILLLAAPATAQPAPVIYLDQGWSKEDREWYYQVSQGSTALPYDLFLNLEVATSQDLFRSDANSDRYGLITQAANPRNNPDGLPIGLAKTVVTEGRSKGTYVGITCAACHNTQLNFKGKRIRVDGGVGNTFDMMAYVQALDDALQATLADSARFGRLAGRLKASSPEAKTDLRKRFESEAARVHEYRTRTLASAITWGPARIDAIAMIVNRLTATLPGIPENTSTPLAPTKPPFLWNAPHATWTQWRGVQQDPIQRNLTETMGVFLDVDLQSKSPAEGLFDSNAAISNLQQIENLLTRLAPPKWPEEVFGKIDRKKAEAGKALFISNCSDCHNAWPYTWTEPNKHGKRFLLVGLVPQSYVGTDKGQFDDLRPYAITGQLSDQLPPLKGEKVVPTGQLYETLQEAVLAKAISKLKLTDAQAADLHGYREFPLPPKPMAVYKAAPRDGVWATPPFLHNGSVPNLYELLLPASERTKKFYVGREFDPVKVGLDTRSGTFLLDTTLRGNSNAGHSFEDGPLGNGVIGPRLSDEQRWAIIEYLKSIPEQAGRVTPFGGPPASPAR
jgi:hypothetical protein